jgi:DNA replication protein DnaC
MSSLSRHNQIMRIYSRRQDENRSALEKRRAEVYKLIPEIERLDKRPGAIAMERYRAYMAAGDEKVLEPLRGELSGVARERTKLLEAAGYPADYLEMHYTCPYCKDTGYVDGEYCGCYLQMERAMLQDQSQLQAVIRTENFDVMTMEYYDDEQVIEAVGQTQRSYMEKVIGHCREFAREFDGSRNIMFTGGTGTGKSFLSHCICAELLKSGHSVICLSATDLFEVMSTVRMDRDADDAVKELRERILDCELLVIDDLGSEVANTMTVSDLFYILDKRLAEKRSTIISTNLSANEMKAPYSERITSRIHSKFDIYPLFGNDIRML